MQMPKMAFLGTSVYFFTLLNLFKIPFLVYLNIITIESASANVRLLPFVAAGAFFGFSFAKKVNQLWFERSAFWLTIVAVGYMILNSIKELFAIHG